MTQQEIQLVKTSWRNLRLVDPEVIGDLFYTKLFYAHPSLRALFRTDPTSQSLKLVDMLNVIVGCLDRFEEITETLTALAMRHRQYGVKPAHYKAVGETLVWTLAQGLGAVDRTPDMEAAWLACFNDIARVMIEGAYGEKASLRS